MPELKIPAHIAIIMDGNGRWAKSKNRSRAYGHRAGHTAVLKTVKQCIKLGVKSLTLYAFSNENWNRPQTEINALMLLFSQAMKRNYRLIMKQQIKFNVIGDISAFSDKLQLQIKKLEKETLSHQGLTLNIAANYGGKWDIVNACKKVYNDISEKKYSIGELDEKLFEKNLSLADQPDIDLLIRTSGEQRISNFLLWQCAYTEFYFTDKFWPEFDELELERSIQSFSNRQRRFGGL